MCPSRKRTTSIMSHGGFGELTMQVNGIAVVIPKNFMFKDGQLKKKSINLINRLGAQKISLEEFYSYAK